ncbi:MAG: PAS domain-containing sensor histidine kinase [Magnetospirillum sp. WYHS-4]
MIESVARFDAKFSTQVHPGGAVWATLGQITGAYLRYKGLGETGEFVLGLRQKDAIVFLSSRENEALPSAPSVEAESELGEPMRRALKGQSGVMVALDYRGTKVLAAYEPIPALEAGLVAKIDWSEATAPFVKAAVVAAGSLAFVLVVAGIAFRQLSVPLMRHREVSESLRKLSYALEQSPLMVFITDRQGRIEYVNSRFTEMTGYAPAEAMGRNPRLLKSGDISSDVHRNLWETVLAGGVWRGELLDRRKDGSTFWASVLIAPIRNDKNVIDHFVAIHEDISERKEIERQMVDAVQQTEIANRAKSELLANMSHELRTPLNAIIGFSNMIQEEVFGPVGHDKYREYVKDICSSGEHLLSLINDILDVSAIEAGKLELNDDIVAFDVLAQACLRLIGPRANKGKVRLEYRESDPQPLRVDPRRMKQVLLNLLSNAIKFTPEDGTVVLESQRAPDGSFSFQVRDTGIGMDPDGIAKALLPFGQVDSTMNRKHEGTGLGLPLTVALVELHGGRLSIASGLGQGTTVTVWIPPERIG